MQPQLVSWHEKWSEAGLVIIDIDNGGMDSLDAVEQHVVAEQIPFTVLHDKGGIVCNRYSVRLYPSAYLLDKSERSSGRVTRWIRLRMELGSKRPCPECRAVSSHETTSPSRSLSVASPSSM